MINQRIGITTKGRISQIEWYNNTLTMKTNSKKLKQELNLKMTKNGLNLLDLLHQQHSHKSFSKKCILMAVSMNRFRLMRENLKR